MDIYQLDYILHDPTEDQGWMYHAEVPALQGCRAWGDTPEETLQSLMEVASTFIEIYKEEGRALPPQITALRKPQGTLTLTA